MSYSYQELWNKTKEKLSLKYEEGNVFDETFADVDKVVNFQNGNIYVLVPSVFRKTKINNMYMPVINEILKQFTDETVKLFLPF